MVPEGELMTPFEYFPMFYIQCHEPLWSVAAIEVHFATFKEK